MGRRRVLPGVDRAAGELSDFVKVISHPDRLRLIVALRRDEVDVQSLADALGLPATRVSQHLSVLRAHRIVARRSEGRHRLYRLAEPAMAQWILDGLQLSGSAAGKRSVVTAGPATAGACFAETETHYSANNEKEV